MSNCGQRSSTLGNGAAPEVCGTELGDDHPGVVSRGGDNGSGRVVENQATPELPLHRGGRGQADEADVVETNLGTSDEVLMTTHP